MSKDKGSKNHKKAPNKTKDKHESAYKSESTSKSKTTVLEAFQPKEAPKKGKND
jgi:hypothetical protein